MRFRIEPRDVPLEVAARRLGKTRAELEAMLPDLLARGFPQADPITGNFDLAANVCGTAPGIAVSKRTLRMRLANIRSTNFAMVGTINPS
jgi:hypothetical protein